MTGPSPSGPFDVTAAVRFPHDSLYAPRLVRHGGRWNLIGFRDLEDGRFVGELTDPIPVTSVAGTGLVPDAVPRSNSIDATDRLPYGVATE